MIRLANAPVSWGIYEFEGIEPRFPYGQVLDEIAAAGYSGTELGPYGYLPTEPERLRAELDARGLALLSAFVPVRLMDPYAHAQAEAEALRVGRLLAALGAQYLVLADANGSVLELVQRAGQRRDVWLDTQGMRTVARGVDQIARAVADQCGLKLVVHHHCAGVLETPDEIRLLLDLTNPDLVGLCLDTGHWHYAGGDAVECVREFGERVRYLHFKDCESQIAARCRSEKLDYFKAVAAGVFCPLGAGEVDFPQIVTEMQARGYDGWAIVEQDILTEDPSAPLRYARANRAYLQGLGL